MTATTLVSTWTASPRFLHRVLAVDALSCLATGTLQLAGGAALAAQLGLPGQLLMATGLFLLAYAALAFATSRAARPPRALVLLFVAGNALWAVGCVALAALHARITPWGIAWLGAQAVVVLVLAELQWVGLRRA